MPAPDDRTPRPPGPGDDPWKAWREDASPAEGGRRGRRSRRGPRRRRRDGSAGDDAARSGPNVGGDPASVAAGLDLPDPPEPIYADARLVAFDKPSGLLSVPGVGPEKLDSLVLRAQGTHAGCRIVHRLDRDTSGVIVLARDAEAHRDLSIQFQERAVSKQYVAVVAGRVAEPSGTIDRAMRKDVDDPPRQCLDEVHGRPARTHFRVLDVAADRTRLEFRPVTGRSHQLRLHAVVLGHPILGDDLYAPPEVQAMADRLLLHATHLTLAHPDDGRPLDLTCPAPF